MKRIGLIASAVGLFALSGLCACTRVGDLTSATSAGTTFENSAPNRQVSDPGGKKFSGAALGTTRNLTADENGVKSNWSGNTPPGAAVFTIDNKGMPVFATETPGNNKIENMNVKFSDAGKLSEITIKGFESTKTDVVLAGNQALAGWAEYIKSLPPNQVQAIKEAAAAGNEFAKILVPAIEALATGGASAAATAAGAVAGEAKKAVSPTPPK